MGSDPAGTTTAPELHGRHHCPRSGGAALAILELDGRLADLPNATSMSTFRVAGRRITHQVFQPSSQRSIPSTPTSMCYIFLLRGVDHPARLICVLYPPLTRCQ